MRSLGLDIGERRIGVALSDPDGILASPLTIINRTDESLDIEAIIDIVKSKDAGRVIVGLPCSLDGSLGEQAEKVKAFTRKLTSRLQVPLEYRDERLTTVMAERLGRAAGKKAKRKAGNDAQAAALILQGYLDEGH
jgi:putative Holliday junction resolvase